MKVVLDTNVLLVSISDRSSTFWVFQYFIDEKYTICVTTDILLEYEEVIGRHVGSEVAKFVLAAIENATNVVLITRYFKWNLIKADPDDNKFVDCAIAGNAQFIVTEDKHFQILDSIPYPKVKVLNIPTFQAQFDA